MLHTPGRGAARWLASQAERTTYRVQVLERAVDIPQVLSEDSASLAAGAVAERLSLHKSTIHRLLTVLNEPTG